MASDRKRYKQYLRKEDSGSSQKVPVPRTTTYRWKRQKQEKVQSPQRGNPVDTPCCSTQVDNPGISQGSHELSTALAHRQLAEADLPDYTTIQRTELSDSEEDEDSEWYEDCFIPSDENICQDLELSDDEYFDCGNEEQSGADSVKLLQQEDQANSNEQDLMDNASHPSDDQVNALLLLALQVKHNLTDVAVKDMAELINVYSNGAIKNKSIYLQNKILKDYQNQFEVHHLCPKCKSYLGIIQNHELSCSCGKVVNVKSNITEGNYFIYLPLKYQLESIVQDDYLYKKINENIRSRMKETTSNIEDIYDGLKYKEIMKSVNDHVDGLHLSLTFNSDGVPVFKSSKYCMWPVLLTLNELPHKLRNQQIMVSNLWFGEEKPRMEEFFKPLIKELKVLEYDGFTTRIQGAEDVLITCYTHTILGICDSVARPLLQNMTQFNGLYGCSYCLHPGERISKGHGHCRVYPFSEDFEKRSKENWENHAVSAESINKKVIGVKGKSFLSDLPHFDIVTGMVPDYMHCVLLGITRQFCYLWFGSKNHEEPFYIGNQCDKIDQRLCSIKPPSTVSRTPRSIKTTKFWKAHEWYVWLLFYSIIVLKDILPAAHLSHWCFFVQAVYLLLGGSISKSNVYVSKSLLAHFVKTVESLYGKQNMTFNVHLSLHLSDSVLCWGPLWCQSAFAYEHFNGILLNMVRSSNCVPIQVCHSLLKRQALIKMDKSINNLSENQQLFVSKMVGGAHKSKESSSQIICEGKEIKCTISNEQRIALVRTNVQVEKNEEVFYCNRVYFNGETFYSLHNNPRVKKRNSYTVLLKNGMMFIVHYILRIKMNDYFAIGHYLNVIKSVHLVGNLPPNVTLGHITPVRASKDTDLTSVPVTAFKTKAIFIEGSNFNLTYDCVIIPANTYDVHM